MMASACGDVAAPPPPGEQPCSTPLSLQPGDVRMLNGAANIACIVLASNTAAGEHLFITANATAAQDNLQPYAVKAVLGMSSAAATARSAPVASHPDGLPQSTVHDSSQFQAVFEGRLRRTERAHLGAHALSTLAAASRADRFAREFKRGASAVQVNVGDTLTFRVGNAASSNLCSTFQSVRAVVKAVSSKATIVQDISAPPGGFSQTDFLEMAGEFDSVIYPTDASWFGTPTDVNADARITILFTPEINKLTPAGSLGYAGGFFHSADLLARSIPSQGYSCNSSNEQEILYLLVPDPNGLVNGNRFSVTTARESSRGTTAHELQHMINQGVRQTASGTGKLEVTWLNEGLSHFAEEAVGRAARGFSDYRRLTWNNVLTDLDDFDSFFRQNLLRFRFWMQRPDLASPISELAGSQLAPRGAAWALVRYSIDQYSNGDARAFTRALVAGPQIDVQNLEARARVPFEQILPGFLIANFADTVVVGLGARFQYSSWAMRDAMNNLNGGVSPLRVTPLPTDAQTQSLSGSGNYFLVSRSAGGSAVTFKMLSATGGAVAFPEARVYVVRVK
ncbi:MAG: hypothetical protein H7Z40_12700 [Phycisphaerae bacterium]|nr:hypothetical protein [Gemmatimonadaceae bacterium]